MTPSVLRARSLVRSFDGRVVLGGVDLDVDPGHRLGVVGENGVGKSTLLRLLAGVDDPDSGTLERPAGLGYLGQEPDLDPAASVADVVEAALADVREIAADLERAAGALPGDATGGAADAYAAALARAELAGVWDADRRAERALAGLGLGTVDRSRTVGSLSGGQRSRLALVALLVRQPAALLLDEPTNHLDDDAATYLADALRAVPGAVVLTSHDRVFLDEVCTQVLDLDPGVAGPTRYGGTFTDYLGQRRRAREQWEQRYREEQDELAALRVAVADTARRVGHDRPMQDANKMAFGRRGDRVEQKVSRRVQDARRRLAALEAAQVRRPPAPLRLAMPVPRTSGAPVALTVRDALVPGRLDVPALDVVGDAKLLVTGPNGSGKSTLLHLLAGDLAPARGSVRRARGVEVALLEQDVGLTDDARTPQGLYDLVTADLPAAPRLAELGLVAPRDLGRPLRELSVGQRRRVVLALLVARAPQVLLLDEPTNHVSVALAGELTDALRAAPGAVVVATHDRWLRRRWDGPTLEVVDGRAAAPARR